MAANSMLEKSLTVPAEPIWRLTIEQYHQMIDDGILTEDDPVELLEGWLVTKMPKNRPHSLATQLTRESLAQIVPSDWYVDAREPITTADSEPEPDVIVVRGDRRNYVERHPYPEDVALIVEVADATLQRDRTLKLRLYASARIPVYWILNLPERQLEVYSDPIGQGEKATYRQHHSYRQSDTVPVMIGGEEIARLSVGQLLA
jgi:Uma2 family endonuclease